MSRRRRKKARHKKTHGVHYRPFRLAIPGVELARGHDGFLRGNPEPAFVFALFSGGGSSVRLLARQVVEVPMQTVRSFPATVVLEDRRAMMVGLPTDGPLLLLALAVEVDSGELLQHLYARVEQPDRFHAFNLADPTPAPVGLHELARSEPHPMPASTRLSLLWDDDDLEKFGGELGDDYVGASAVVLRSPVGGKRSYRMHFVSADERNDWTVALTVGERW